MESGAHLDVIRLLRCVPGDELESGKQMLVEIVSMMTVMMRKL
jgi:hypothetical protein